MNTLGNFQRAVTQKTGYFSVRVNIKCFGRVHTALDVSHVDKAFATDGFGWTAKRNDYATSVTFTRKDMRLGVLFQDFDNGLCCHVLALRPV